CARPDFGYFDVW
nr:immunoglobulin heavy chain junction region [Mus musculus]